MPQPTCQFRVGAPERPPIRHDNGHLDRFARRRPTAADRRALNRWRLRLHGGEAIQLVPFHGRRLPDALAAYRHFLFGGGRPRTFDFEKYARDDPAGRNTVTGSIHLAQQAVEQLYQAHYAGKSGSFSITSTSAPVRPGWDPPQQTPSTENWQKTIGSYRLWLSAHVVVAVVERRPRYTMQLTVHGDDRYNFNPGERDIRTQIPDAENGRFEVTGLAHQYDHRGELVRRVTWAHGAITVPIYELVRYTFPDWEP